MGGTIYRVMGDSTSVISQVLTVDVAMTLGFNVILSPFDFKQEREFYSIQSRCRVSV